MIFPSPCEFPPISIILFSRDVNDGSALIHAATLVKGPNPISVMLPVEKVVHEGTVNYCKFVLNINI